MSSTYQPLLLILALSLAACQSAERSDAPALQLQARPAQTEAENAQLLASPAGARLQITPGKGLQLLDAQGQVQAEFPGRFEGLDHRAGTNGLLIATLDKRRQQVLLLNLDTQRQWSAPQYLPKGAAAVEGLCLQRDAGGHGFVFVLGEEGVGEQWLVAADDRPMARPQRVRGLSLPPESSACQVDDARGLLYVNEESVGLWAYAADPEAPLLRQPVDLRQPFGGLSSAAGIALVPGGLLALDPQRTRLHLYQQQDEGWQSVASLPLPGLDEPEQISAQQSADGLQLLLIDKAGLQSARLAWQPSVPAAPGSIPSLPAQAQTDPVPSLGDAADDPAIWVHPHDPARSRVLATDKQGGLVVYDLQGRQVQDLRVGRLNNVDVRTGFRLGALTLDLAVASHRDDDSLQLFAIDPSSGTLSDLGRIATPLTDIYGLCMYKDAHGDLHAIANDKDGTFLQYRLDGASGTPRGELVRRFQVDSQPEGCVADERHHRLFVGEEDVAVWSLDARAEAEPRLHKVIGVGGPLHADVEGLAVYQGDTASYLVVSSQGNDSYLVLDALPPHAVRGAFRVGLNAERGIDGASETDGLEVTSANLGGLWSRGLLVVQDGRKRMPEGTQNYKYLPWSAVADALQLD